MGGASGAKWPCRPAWFFCPLASRLLHLCCNSAIRRARFVMSQVETSKPGAASGTPSSKPPVAQLNAEQINRYKRHLILPEVGMDGQKKLLNARVLCIGAGGLGCPIS